MRCLRSALICLLVALCGTAAIAQKKPFIDWQILSNPVLSYPGWSIKDAAMAYRDGTFYVFFSAFYPERGQVRSHVVEVSTHDFKHFSEPILNFDGEEEDWFGMCSPDVQRLGGNYVMTFNSWGDKPGKPNLLFYMTSEDLVHWSPRQTLARNLTHDKRVIDAALAEADRGYYLIWKEGTQGNMKPRLAFTTALDQPFKFVGDGFPVLLMKDGKDNSLTHENYEFVYTLGKWYLLTTDYNPEGPYLYQLDPGSGWLKWTQGYRLQTPKEKFNTDHRDNAAALYDWRQYDGYYYLIYGGRTEGKTFAGRGWNQLGLSRSKDLIHWSASGVP
ncbi:MAG: hypothetical protein ABSC65_18140 [Acidobacteriaceae bacterium]|jgi:hypothetical protein